MMTCTFFGPRCSNGNFRHTSGFYDVSTALWYSFSHFLICLPVCLPKCVADDAVEISFVFIESVFELEISFSIQKRVCYSQF